MGNVKHVILLIHGTWGRDPAGWYQPACSDENFASRLAAKLAGTPLEGAVWGGTEVFEWSGENTHQARLTAARELAERLLEIRQRHPAERLRFHLVAHSHGGNVVLAALLIYLTLLPPWILNSLGFPTLVREWESTTQFFDAARRFVTFGNFHLDNPIIQQDPWLSDEVRRWLDKVGQLYAKYSARQLILHEGLGLNLLILRLAFILLRLNTFPTEHGIASIVFLGTPFYYKRWRSDWRRCAIDRLLNAVANGTLMAMGAYALIVLSSAVLSWLSLAPWIGIHPLHWYWPALVLMAAPAVWGAITGSRQSHGIADTNVYFDETMFLKEAERKAMADLGGRPLFDALVIKSGYLDEAFAGLSSFPLIRQITPNLVDILLKPKLWTFPAVVRETGRYRTTMGERMRRLTRALVRYLRAVLLLLLYPVRRSLYALVTRPIVMRQAARIALPLSYGLPGDELLASDIVTAQDLNIPQIRAQHVDVARDLLTAARDVQVDQRRFEFLWDDEALQHRYAESVMAAHFGLGPPADVQRHLLAIEERLREFFGVAGLRHALYYENEQVLAAVCEYLKGRAERL
ncbi:MAG TPA: hypothetical protein VI542_21965 [Candidatus Tectomicrobia bacterium]